MFHWTQSFGVLAQHNTQLLFLQGFETTVMLFVVSWVGAFILGTLLTVFRASGGSVPTFLVTVFVEYHRNVPSIVQILVWYFGVPQLLPQSWQLWANNNHGEFIFAAIALILNAAAYISEDLRSGFRALPGAQLEASRALGLTYLQSMRLVLVPQAIRAAMPALLNQTLGLFKSTSLAMAAGVGEMLTIARQLDGETYATFAVYLVPTVIYLICSTCLQFGGGRLQERLDRPLRRAS